MKKVELNEMTTEELMKKQKDLQEDLFRLRLKLSTSELEDTSKIKKTRRMIARTKTLFAKKLREGQNGE